MIDNKHTDIHIELETTSNTNPIVEVINPSDNLVYVYCRTSTKNQTIKKVNNVYLNKESWGFQLEYCRQYAFNKNLISKSGGLYDHATFYGECKSASILDSSNPLFHRDELFNCFEGLLIAKQDYKHLYLMCYSVSRLTRSVIDAKRLLESAKLEGITLVFAKENLFVTDLESEKKFFDFVKEAEDDLEKILKGILEGQDFNREHGLFASGSIPFGKQVNEAKFLVDNLDEKYILNLAKNLKNLNWTNQKISDHLNNKGYKTKRGLNWKPDLVRNILNKLEVDSCIKNLYKELKNLYKSKDLKLIQETAKSLILQIAKVHNITISMIEGTPSPDLIKDKALQKQLLEAYKLYSSHVKKKGVSKSIRYSQAFYLSSVIGNLASILVSNLTEPTTKKIKIKIKR